MKSILVLRALRQRISLVCLSLFVLSAMATNTPAQETADFYRQNCMSCHTIGGGRLVGPDLKDVDRRQDREWLIRFILNPQAVINSGDPEALRLLDEARGVVMPTVAGITRDRANSLLDLIIAESALEKSQFAGLQISDRPFTAADRMAGREYFTGTRQFANGGPACVSCHTIRGLGGLGGGRLGPDLTKAYERIGGRKPLVAWLSGPATTTMKPIYAKHALLADEILPLAAHMEQAAQQAGEDTSVAATNFLLIGLSGTVFLLFAFDIAWRRRFRGVRGPLVSKASERSER